MPTINRIDTGNDAAIAAAIAEFEVESAQEKADKAAKAESDKAAGDNGKKEPKEEVVAVVAVNGGDAPLAAGEEEPKPSTLTSNAPTFPVSKRTFSADDCSNDEALAWALHEAELPSNKGPSAFARAAAQGFSPSTSSPPPSPPSPASAAALAASAPLSDWRALLERAASERIAGERFAPLVPRPLPAAPPWPWSGIAGGIGGIGGIGSENRERARLAATLARYGLCERAVKGDGACQFRALSDQLYGSEDYHEAVRGLAVQTLAAHPERYAAFIAGGGGGGAGDGTGNGGGDPNLFTSYVARMSNAKEWGDHVTLQAAADGLGLRIVVVSSFESEPLIEIEPAEKRSARVLFIAFWHEIHYGSVYVAPPPAARPSLPVAAMTTEKEGEFTAEGGFGQPGAVADEKASAPRSGASTPERIRRWFRERLA